MGYGLKHKSTHCPSPIAYSPASIFMLRGARPEHGALIKKDRKIK